MSDFIIENANLSDMHFFSKMAEGEGWNPGLHDTECFYAADPNGFFIGKLDGKPIACASAVNYSDDFAFLGLYIVAAKYRQQGYGSQLWNKLLEYAATRPTGLDGVLEMEHQYNSGGFVAAYKAQRYVGQAETMAIDTSAVKTLSAQDLTIVSAYDQQHFLAQRLGFLSAWLSQAAHISLGYYQNDNLQGYCTARPCVDGGYKIGPLFAESPTIATALIAAVFERIAGKTVYLDIPEPNQAATAFAKEQNMKPVFACLRMYRNGAIDLDLNKIWGITSFELG